MENTKEFAGKRILIIVENLPVPFDRRVWREAKALSEKGAKITIICPKGKNYKKNFEVIDDIYVYRHNLPFEARSTAGYIFEYIPALFWEFILSIKCSIIRGFDAIHACNPPDLIFLIGLFFKIFGKKFLFDHHDISPELYLAKFEKKDFFYRCMLLLERLTFKLADVSIATNKSYKEIAIKRGKMQSNRVFIVRGGPDLNRVKLMKPVEKFKNGRKYLVGYVGVIGKQEGLEYLAESCRYIVEEKNRKDIHFICLGSGTDLDNIKEYVREKGVEDFFTFTGRVSDKVLFQALSTADVCINPDLYNELNDKSTMTKIMEYMALKKPIVQFDLKEGKYSAQEASLYAKPGDYIDLAKKILELVDNPKKRQKMGEIGYKRVKEKLLWEYQKENLYNAYRLLFKNISK
jgi:glycosyltransferase involved in cell wall biosynthesis